MGLVIENNIIISINFDILHIYNKNSKLNVLEFLEFNRHKYSPLLLNDELHVSNLPIMNIVL